MRRQDIDWQKIFAKHISYKGLVSKYAKTLNTQQKESNPIKKMKVSSEQILYQKSTNFKPIKRC